MSDSGGDQTESGLRSAGRIAWATLMALVELAVMAGIVLAIAIAFGWAAGGAGTDGTNDAPDPCVNC